MKAIISSGGNAGREERLKNGNIRIYNDEGTGYVERDAEGNLVRSGSSGTEDWNQPGASPVIKYGGGSYNSDTGEYRIRNGLGDIVETGKGSQDDYSKTYEDMVSGGRVSDSLGRVRNESPSFSDTYKKEVDSLKDRISTQEKTISSLRSQDDFKPNPIDPSRFLNPSKTPTYQSQSQNQPTSKSLLQQLISGQQQRQSKPPIRQFLEAIREIQNSLK